MGMSSSQLNREIKVATFRQSSRYLLDILRFGNGLAERLCAAFLYSSLFFAIVFIFSLLAGFNFAVALSLSLCAILFAFLVLSFFVFGGTDEDIADKIEVLSKDKSLLEAKKANDKNSGVTRRESRGDSRGGIAIRQLPSLDLPPSNQVISYSQSISSEPDYRVCPYCAEEIQYEAKKCKHCGEILDRNLKLRRESDNNVHIKVSIPKWSPGVAALLSFLIPGAGQMYKGQIINGLCWFFIVILGYACILPGILFHLLCIIGASSGNPYED